MTDCIILYPVLIKKCLGPYKYMTCMFKWKHQRCICLGRSFTVAISV